MLKLWQGKDGGSIIVSKSDPQHEFMQELGFKLLVGFNYASLNRLDPGDFTIYRAADYLGNDSIYRCMRINDDTDVNYMVLKKDRHFRAKVKQQNKIVMEVNEIVDVTEEDSNFLACAACKRTFRNGHKNRHSYHAKFKDYLPPSDELELEFKNIVCCDKYYALGIKPNSDGRLFAFCTTKSLFGNSWGHVDIKTDSQKLVVDYLMGRKEGKKVERANK